MASGKGDYSSARNLCPDGMSRNVTYLGTGGFSVAVQPDGSDHSDPEISGISKADLYVLT